MSHGDLERPTAFVGSEPVTWLTVSLAPGWGQWVWPGYALQDTHLCCIHGDWGQWRERVVAGLGLKSCPRQNTCMQKRNGESIPVIFLCTIACSLLSELQTMDVWATFQSFLGNCPLPSKSPSSFQVPLSSAKGKFLFLGEKKGLMQACLKALRLLGHPMALSTQRSDEFMYTSRGHRDGIPTKINNSLIRQKHAGGYTLDFAEPRV